MTSLPLTFEPIGTAASLSRQQAYLKALAGCEEIASDYSFVNLWGWAEIYGLEWAWRDELVWIRQTLPRTIYWAPVGPWHAVDWQTRWPHLLENQEIRMIRVPDTLIDRWRRSGNLKVTVEETRGQWDYVYSVSDLIALKGRAYHKKKNLLNQFLKTYDHRFVSFSPDLVAQALSLQEDWCLWRDCENSRTLSNENRVIEKVLRHWDRLNALIGGAVLIDGRVAAYTVGEPLGPDTLLIHFEKASPEIRGGYQAINQLFLSHMGTRFSKVNREQDLDDPGLRKAKLSYRPVEFVVKHAISIAHGTHRKGKGGRQ